MAHCFGLGASIPLSVLTPKVSVVTDRKIINLTILLALLNTKLKMEQKVYRRISDNIYQTLQEHKDATRELAKIQLSKKAHVSFEKMQDNRKGQTIFFKKGFPIELSLLTSVLGYF
jgi:hypothetical protein